MKGDIMKLNIKKCFTLAEVLITLIVVGVVAALTLPTLFQSINSKVEARKIKVIEKKFITGLNLLNINESGLSRPYASTEEFVKHLSKHLKMVSICSNDNLGDCFPYNEITYEGEKVNLSHFKDPKNLDIVGSGFSDTASFMLADGTSFLISYKQDCSSVDPDRQLTAIPNCVAGFYDINGPKSPNRFGPIIWASDGTFIGGSNDIKQFGAIQNCAYKIDGKCLLKAPFVPEPVSCSAVKDEFEEITTCKYNNNNDYWAGALVACKELGGHLASKAEAASISSRLHYLIKSHKMWVSGEDSDMWFVLDDPTKSNYATYNKDAVIKIGISENHAEYFYIFIPMELGNGQGCNVARKVYPTSDTIRYSCPRNVSNGYAFCFANDIE